MILVFGGTTEGRKAVEVLEEAGSLYYYSTRSDGQKIDLIHGVHLMGDLDVPKMIAVCKENGIRLIVDAAHPFAEELHRNLLFLAKHINAPIIRYDRIYPPHSSEVVWCKDFQEAVTLLEAHGIQRLLALTGVNTIGRLSPYWEKHEACWFRILNRRASQMIAKANRFPEERLVYYEDDETADLIERLHPEAIITKESGLSGGFCEKVESARQAGIKVFAVERPAYPRCRGFAIPDPQNVQIEMVNGPYGLRRAVEKLLPEFYPLHSGLTTGTCATAAAVAAALASLHSLSGICNPRPFSEVPVVLPDGETIHVPVTYGDGYASVFKEAGDDPDVTNGLEIRACVEPSDTFEICAGEGVGRFTLPGFDFPPGSPAINKAPREMIRHNLSILLTPMSGICNPRPPLPLKVTISVPQGAEIARRTFNPRLGIEGGISIIGVSGIVKPFSEEAFILSIRKCMQVAKASGSDRVVINSGGKSERFVKTRYPDLPRQAFVEYGNYIGETLRIADELGFRYVTLGVMLGKAVKLAAGHLDTHSRKAVMEKDFIRQMLRETGLSLDLSGITLARELWNLIPSVKLQAFCEVVIRHCASHCLPLLPDGTLEILLIDEEGHIYDY